MCNALLHLGWVTVLAACQTYQILWLGMTTNERMNRGRYRHFQAAGGRSPFSRGPVRNAADFFECGCFGLVPANRIDWQIAFELDKHAVVEKRPLLRAPASENYQCV